MDPRTAYQTLHMLEGVVQRGTAVTLHDLGIPMFGKTGTTSGPTNVWFVGGTPNIIGGLYVGYDQPRSLGGYMQGGTFAAPIFKQFVTDTRARWDHTPFQIPQGVRMVRIDRVSGQRVFSGVPSEDAKAEVIWEAFKPETQPQHAARGDALAARRSELMEAIRRGFQALGGRVAGVKQEAPEADFVVEQGN